MVGEGSTFRIGPGWIRWRADAPGRLRQIGLDGLDQLSSRALGSAVEDRRTSWVRRVTVDLIDLYVKTYDYPSARDRIRGLFRTTALARSRAHREWDALVWLGRQGFARPEPWAVLEQRTALGVLRRAVLVTAACPGQRLDRLLPELEPRGRDACLRALRRCLRNLHDAGFRDRNPDLRNWLGRRLSDGGWLVAKLDAPRYRIRPLHRNDDRLARADRARLDASLAALGLAWPDEDRRTG